MKNSKQRATVAGAIFFACWNTFGMGGDYPDEKNVNHFSWPKGMNNLVNRTNRVCGHWIVSEEIFYFSGTSMDFNSFLEDYSRIRGVEKHLLIFHDGVGEALSLKRENRGPCDWKLYGCDALRRNTIDSMHGITNTPSHTNYTLEVHFWMGGQLVLEKLNIPKNIEIKMEAGR